MTPKRKRWLARELGVEPDHISNLMSGKRDLQPDSVEVLARIMGLDAEEREYLRRLVALRCASPQEARAATLSVWETYAAKKDEAHVQVARLLQRAPSGPTDMALLPALPLIRELPGVDLSPDGLGQVLLLPPDPGALERLITRSKTETFGALDGTRFCALPGPGPARGLGAEVWKSSLALARHSLLAFPDPDREFHAVTWAVDEVAGRQVEQAQVRLVRRLRSVVRRHAESRPGQVLMLLIETLRVSQIIRPPDKEYRPDIDPGLAELSAAAKAATNGEDPPQPAPSTGTEPCLYRFQDFSSFAQTWINHREGIGRASSARWLGRRSVLSRSLINSLCNGTTTLQMQHIPGLITALNLDPAYAPYLEGLARMNAAPDRVSRAREQHLLAAYAASKGERTSGGNFIRFLSHWAPQVIYELASLPGYYFDGAWAHFALGGRVSLPDASQSLAALVDLKLLDRNLGRPTGKAVVQISELAEATRLAYFGYHDNLLEMFTRDLLFPSPDRTLHGYALTVPDRAWPEVLDSVLSYQADVRHIYEAGSERSAGLDRVVITATQLFPLARLKAR